jgi:hypothetical protein
VINVRDENARRRQQELRLLTMGMGQFAKEHLLQLGVPGATEGGCQREGSGAVPLGWRLAKVDVDFMDCMAGLLPARLASVAKSN